MPAATTTAAKKAKAPLKTSKAVLVALSDDDDDLAGPSQNATIKPKKALATKGKVKGSDERAGPQTLDAEADTEPEGEEDIGDAADVTRRLAALTKENSRLKAEKEAFANQFSALSTLKTSSAEAVYEKGKKAAESRATDNVIGTLTKFNETLQAKAKDMERELAEARIALLAPVLPVDPKEVRSLKDEIKRLGNELRGRDAEISTLQKMYEAEVSRSKTLLNSSSSAAPSAKAKDPLAAEDAAKAHCSLKLYSELTDLEIRNVKITSGANGGEVITYNCIQHHDDKGHSMNFRLQSYSEYDSETQQPIRSVRFTPLNLEHEDKQRLRQLEPFHQEFEIERNQLGALWDQLKGRLSDQEEHDEIPVL